MNTSHNPIIRVWKWWFTPRSTDPTVVYRERALRVLLPTILIVRTIAIANNYSGAFDLHTPYFPFWVALAAYLIPILFATILLIRGEINWAGAFFLLQWYLTDMINLPTDGYWLPGFQISIIIQGVLGTLLLPSRAIYPFMIFQLITVGMWGGWLDANHFTTPLLSTGEPVTIYQRAFFVLAAQETILVSIVRYLRMEMEKYLRLQQITIQQLEEEVSERQHVEARLRGVFENSPDNILEIDRAGQIIFINKYAETYLGKNVRDVVPADQLDTALKMIERAFNSGEPQTFELQTIAPDNRISWDSIRMGSVKHGDQITSLTVIMTEITAQKDAEAALRASEELYRLISTITADYVFSTQLEADGQLHLKWVGGAFESITGHTFEGYVACGGWLAALHPDDRKVDAHDMDILRTNQNVISEVRTVHKSGAMRWVRVYAHPLWDSEHNRLTGIYGAVQDITERKKAEEEREKLFKEIEAQNAELERFNYTISHELKSPVVTIKGFLGMLKRDIEENNQNYIQKDLNRIAEATDKMGIMLSELLELSRIGRIVNPPEEVDLGKLIQVALETLDGRLHTRNITVTVSPDLPTVYADRIRLREVLENLIDNAAKYMGNQPRPLIEIGKQQSGTETILYIKDNGIGIEPQFHTKIFGLFEKLSADSEGTGIGLALIKRIIEVHGGRIWVESEGFGKGSTFCFTVPDKRGESAKEMA